MGVEYKHFLTVAQSHWLPQPKTLTEIDSLLRKWLLVSGAPEVYDITGGKQRRIPDIPDTTPGAGVAVIYPTVQGAVVSQVVGPSYYGASDEDRYLQSLTVLAGTDFRIHISDESYFINVTLPPTDAGKPVEPYEEQGYLYIYSEGYPATGTTTPPKVSIEVEPKSRQYVGWNNFPGFWRAALVLDCGKDLPSFVDGKHILPSMQFVNEAAERFGSQLHQIGLIY